MKFSYKFSNLLGTVYRKGNLLFTNDGNSVISPVGNRISIFDLKNNRTSTLPVESRFNFILLDLSPSGAILAAVNEEGELHLVSMMSLTVVHRHRFKGTVTCLKFSPDGKYLAASKENNLFLFQVPGQFDGQFNQFIMKRVFHASLDDTTGIAWSDDSSVIAVASKDGSTKIFGAERWANFHIYSLGGHSEEIMAVFFETKSLDVVSLSKNGRLVLWDCNIDPSDLVPFDPEAPRKKAKKRDTHILEEDDIDLSKGEEREKALQEEADIKELPSSEAQEFTKLQYSQKVRHYLKDNFKEMDTKNVSLTCADYHKGTHILVTGFSNGSFFIHELPDVNLIHSLSISENSISSLALNKTGDWLAIGCSLRGQLVVWEWQSESYIMKQQGHENAMSTLAYSHDGAMIVTGGEDGKVKLWNTQSGFCFVTFTEHESCVSAVTFSNNRKFVVTASLDGTVRAFDLARYRNFRTFTSPRPVQFSCLALDSTSELVAAGGQDFFEIYLWSIKIGRLLEVLSGHEGPVSSLMFSPVMSSSALASTSWDKSLKLWNAVETGTDHETVKLLADGLYVVYKPNGKEVAVATLDGNITFFDSEHGNQLGCIEGRNDLGSGRLETDRITAKKTLQAKAFSTLCYSPDGEFIIAAGQSKFICIYNVDEAILIKKFEVTQNRSLDGVDDFINRRKLTEFGNVALVEERDPSEGGNVMLKLPGVKKGDMASRSTKPEIRVFDVQFSPTGQSWAATTTEGLLIYSLRSDYLFDPFELEMGITPAAVKETLGKHDHAKALMMSIRLNEPVIVREVVEKVPVSEIELTVAALPEAYAEKVTCYVASFIEASRHIEFYLLWVQHLVTKFKNISQTTLVLLQKNISKKFQELSKICEFNTYTLKHIEKLSQFAEEKQKLTDDLEEMELDDL
nr:PREDICTED: periodic tryptophan protein 2 homolog [Bemisia tabaci]